MVTHQTGISSREAPTHLQPRPVSSPPPASCLTGYINHSLSVFHTKDFEDPVRIKGSENITECRFGPPASPCVPSELLTPDLRSCPHPRYRDYRNAQDYNFSEQFWTLLAIRLAFLILFEVGRTGGPPPCPPPAS